MKTEILQKRKEKVKRLMVYALKDGNFTNAQRANILIDKINKRINFIESVNQKRMFV